MTSRPPLSSATLAGVFVAVMLLALLVLFPLTLALGGRAQAVGLSATETTGTVWRGRMIEARFGGAPLGDLTVGANPLALLIGQTRLGVRGQAIQAKLQLGGGGDVAVRDLSGRFPLVWLAPEAGIGGTLMLDDVNALFSAEGCGRAAGAAELTAVSLQGLDLPGLELRGAPACGPRGSLVLPLRGQAEGVDVEADLRVARAGGYELDLLVRTTRPEVDAALAAAGFERRLEGRGRRTVGQLAGL